MKAFKILVLIVMMFTCMFLFPEVRGEDVVRDYTVYFGTGIDSNTKSEYILLRQYEKNNQTCYIAIDPQTMKTYTLHDKGLTVTPKTFEQITKEYKDSVYIRLLNYSRKNSKRLLNAGITYFITKEKGIVLSIDLCPSKHGLDRDLFHTLYETFSGHTGPIPIAIAITGKFINKHPEELQWLIDEDKKQALSITWVNHTYNHFYSKKLPSENNFMLKKGTNIRDEILKTEELLVSHNIVPSAFFRFPGLISNDAVFGTICGYGLIPVGGDFWLWKRKLPHDGTIILVHANGNDPSGIVRLKKFISANEKSIKKNEWKILGLRESLIQFIQTH